jgi:hypothetical protein
MPKKLMVIPVTSAWKNFALFVILFDNSIKILLQLYPAAHFFVCPF